MPVMLRSLSTVVVLLIIPCPWMHSQVVDAKIPAAVTASAADDYRSNPKFVEVMKEAKQFERQKRVAFAGDDSKKANKIAGGRCFECLQGLYQAQLRQRNYKDALATTVVLEGLAASPVEKSEAMYYRGRAMVAKGGDKPKPAELEAAHGVFQEAIGQYPKNIAALFADGKVLALLGRMDQARADFQLCVKRVNPTDPARLRAEHFAVDPELSTHEMAPAFEVTALDGTKFNLDAMGGRVVLIDFWATWCGPCIEELPQMRKIAKKFANDPLVIISVSWDSDEQKWKQFVVKNDMSWVQYRDADHAMAEEFGIHSIPHYFTIDSDGVLTTEIIGSGADVEGEMKKLIARARKAKAQALSTPGAQAVSAGN